MPSRCPYFVAEGVAGSCAPQGMRDLRRWRGEGITAAVAVLEEWEMEEDGYPLRQYVEDAGRLGIEVLHVPVRDNQAPPLGDFISLLEWMDRATQRGGVVVHCRAGVGRSPTVLTGYLMRRGLSLEEAFLAVKRANPDASPTRAQWEALEALRRAVLGL
ncbi:hypothetical protein GCM10007981_03450 [Thermocladium modestius]|uniref:Protein phosphatase n=1 Tax=Thermocladium modestius TaxID=62609 RepID=A0A830GUK3_9CREN|nr:dual specificity protein phosphatase family protein [Thermocladium modestius]GGP19503.1 hypothetical protein GCM10007981_03450 [Thermocladium modestius]